MSRLAQMIKNEQARRGATDYRAAQQIGVLQQTFSAWKSGSIPRPSKFEAVSQWLQISIDMMQELADEAKQSTGNTKLPDMGAPLLGRGTAAALTIDRFPIGHAKPSIEGCYAIRVDNRTLWVNPNITPAKGNTVVLRSNGTGSIAIWPAEHNGEVHVVVLAEMI